MTLGLAKIIKILDLQIEGEAIALAIIDLGALRLDVHRWCSPRSAVSAASSQADVDAVFVYLDAGDVVTSNSRYRPDEGDAELLLLLARLHGGRYRAYRGRPVVVVREISSTKI